MKKSRRISLLIVASPLLAASVVWAACFLPSVKPNQAEVAHELPVHKIPNIGPAAEFYFSPDGTHIIGDAKREIDDSYHVYTLNIDGTDIRRINDHGDDACSFYFPNGKRIIWTSTRDHPEIPKANYSDPSNYPQGAEIYSSKLDGSDLKRLTNNNVYDAEVSLSPNGKWVLFGRQTDGKMELWKMRPNGADQHALTHLPGLEPGGCFYFPDSRSIIFRAWKTEDQKNHVKPLPMNLYTIRDDGTGLRQLTNDGGTNWSPYPAPDGRHYVFVKVLPPRRFQLFLGDLQSDRQVRLTYSDKFDGFPVISPDGHWLLFASNRDSTTPASPFTLYLMDISSLDIGPYKGRSPAHGTTK
jgi:Tol biopolymer transport system component